jgi:hypothetical protein
VKTVKQTNERPAVRDNPVQGWTKVIALFTYQ